MPKHSRVRRYEPKCPNCEGPYNPRTGAYSHEKGCDAALERTPLGRVRGAAEAAGQLPGVSSNNEGKTQSFQPVIELSQETLTEMRKRAEFWATRTPEAIKDMEAFLSTNALVLLQLFPAVAMTNVGSRSGLTNRLASAKSFYDLAGPAMDMIRGKKAEQEAGQEFAHAQGRRRRKP